MKTNNSPSGSRSPSPFSQVAGQVARQVDETGLQSRQGSPLLNAAAQPQYGMQGGGAAAPAHLQPQDAALQQQQYAYQQAQQQFQALGGAAAAQGDMPMIAGVIPAGHKGVGPAQSLEDEILNTQLNLVSYKALQEGVPSEGTKEGICEYVFKATKTKLRRAIVGEKACIVAGEAAANGTMALLNNANPDVIKTVISHYVSGKCTGEATENIKAIKVLAEECCGEFMGNVTEGRKKAKTQIERYHPNTQAAVLQDFINEDAERLSRAETRLNIIEGQGNS